MYIDKFTLGVITGVISTIIVEIVLLVILYKKLPKENEK